MRVCKASSGFTYIELLAVITLMALCFVPILRMFTESMHEVRIYSDMGTALQLGRDAMESVKNLRFTVAQIESQGTIWTPEEGDDPFILNGKEWKIKRSAVSGTQPLEVYVHVYHALDLERPIVELVTLLQDL